MRTSEPCNEVIAAFIRAAGIFGPIRKTATAKTPQYSYTYAPFDEVTAATWPALHAEGLCVIQTTDFSDGALTLITRLFHTSGQWIESRWPMPAYDRPQAAGAVLSYFRRYAVYALLGLTPEEDTDAQEVEPAKAVAPKPPEPARTVAPKPPTAASPPPPPTPAPATNGGLITDKQGKRLFAIAKSAGWETDEITAALEFDWHIEGGHTHNVPWRQYDEICHYFKAGPTRAQRKSQDDDVPPPSDTDIPY